ncbi:MAG: DMT family transporter, partial [Bacteroidota bacterium]
MNEQKAQITLAGVLIGLTGVAFFSAKAVMVKLGYRYEVDPITLLLFRMMFALPFYVLIASYQQFNRPQKIARKDLGILILLGVIGYYLASYFDFLGLQYISAGQERIILFVYPTIVLLVSRLVLKTTIKPMQVMAILVTYVGVVITFYPQLTSASFSTNYFHGAGLVFLSAFTYASYLVGSSYLIPKMG